MNSVIYPFFLFSTLVKIKRHYLPKKAKDRSRVVVHIVMLSAIVFTSNFKYGKIQIKLMSIFHSF